MTTPRKPRKARPKKSRTPSSPKMREKSTTPRPVGRPRLDPKIVESRAMESKQKEVERSLVIAEIASARLRYVHGYTPEEHPEGAPPLFESLRDLHRAAGCKVSLRSLEEHSRSEGWVDQRLAFQANVAKRVNLVTTRKLAMAQAKAREDIHAVARLTVREVGIRVKDNPASLSMTDLSSGAATLQRMLRVTTEAADPDAGKDQGPSAGDVLWSLLRGEGLHRPSQEVIDCIPEESYDE